MGVELGILIFAIQGRYDVTPGSLLIVNVNVCVTLYGNKDGKMYLGSSWLFLVSEHTLICFQFVSLPTNPEELKKLTVLHL